MGSQVIGTGSLYVSGFDGHEGTIGVGHETGVTSGVGKGLNGCYGKTVGGEVSGFGSGHIGSINGDDGAVGVGDESTIGVTVVSIRISSIVVGVSTVETVVRGIDALGGKVSCFCGLDLGGLSGGDGTVGVGDEGLSGGTGHDSKENLK